MIFFSRRIVIQVIPSHDLTPNSDTNDWLRTKHFQIKEFQNTKAQAPKTHIPEESSHRFPLWPMQQPLLQFAVWFLHYFLSSGLEVCATSGPRAKIWRRKPLILKKETSVRRARTILIFTSLARYVFKIFHCVLRHRMCDTYVSIEDVRTVSYYHAT